MQPEGQIVAGFEFGPIIGIGTYGEVRCARDLRTGNRVAIKIVDLTRFNDEISSVLREIEILKSINHPHLIKLIDIKQDISYKGTWCSQCACTEFVPSMSGECANCGPHDGLEHSACETRSVLFIVEELAAAGELFGLLMHGGPFPEELARYYFRQLIRGVEYFHSRGYAHRDLKPENLVFDHNFSLKVVDFGLAASFADDERGGLLQTGVGSQPYSAPEVYYCSELFDGSGYKGTPADIWSCAVILFVMITGRPPFNRPLTKTHGPKFRRCKHFIKLLKGEGYGTMSYEAKDMLSRIFKQDPSERLTIQDIKQSAWYNGPVPSAEVVNKIMEDKSHCAWVTQNKKQMVQILEKLRANLEDTPAFSSIPVQFMPFEADDLDLTDCFEDRPVHDPVDEDVDDDESQHSSTPINSHATTVPQSIPNSLKQPPSASEDIGTPLSQLSPDPRLLRESWAIFPAPRLSKPDPNLDDHDIHRLAGER